MYKIIFPLEFSEVSAQFDLDPHNRKEEKCKKCDFSGLNMNLPPFPKLKANQSNLPFCNVE